MGRGRPRRALPAVPSDGDPHGWDPFAAGKARYAGLVPIYNGCRGSVIAPYTSIDELVAAVVSQMMKGRLTAVGRGDVSDKASLRHGITGPDGPRWPIAHVYEGEVHDYLPDYVAAGYPGAFLPGPLKATAKPKARYVIEAGRIRKKASERELAKLVAARDLTRATGGELVFVSSERVAARWVRNALVLHLRAFDYRGPADLQAFIRSEWERQEASIRSVVERLGKEEPPALVAAAAWAAAGEIAREGRLTKVSLNLDVVGLDTSLAALRPGGSIILPPGLITDLDQLVALANEMGGPTDIEEEVVVGHPFKNSEIDPEAIPDAEERDLFRRRVAAAAAHDAEGLTVASAARRFDLPVRSFQMLYERSQERGEAAFYGHASYSRAWTSLPEQMVDLIRKLYSASKRPSITDIVDDRRVAALTKELKIDRSPSWRQVKRVVDHLLETEHAVRQARAGRRSLPLVSRGRSVDVESRPAFLVELDEEIFDAKVLAIDGTEVTVSLHVGVLIDVGTRDILAVVVSPKALDQWDLRRLLLRAILPKGDLKERFGFKADWPTSAIPVIVSTDNGKMMTGKLALQAAAGVPFVLQFVPIRDPHAKPFVEAFFAGLKALFEHRLIITTGSSPDDRGRHDPDKEAARHGITPEMLERALLRHVVEVYRVKTHRGLRSQPGAYWKVMIERLGARTWQGSDDELRRLLKRDEGTRLVTGKGISYLGRWYGGTVLDTRSGLRLRIKVNDDDLRTIDVYTLTGIFLGTVECGELAKRGRSISRWELRLEREVERVVAEAANAKALASAHEIAAELEGDAVDPKTAGRQRHHRDRAAETATTDSKTARPRSTPPPTPIGPSLPAPVAEDDDAYSALNEMEDLDDVA